MVDISCAEPRVCPTPTENIPTNNPPVIGSGGGGGMITNDNETTQVSVCNSTTQTWQVITTQYLDGVAGTPVTTDTGIPCTVDDTTHKEISCECYIDDVNGDGTELVGFIRAYLISVSATGVPTSVLMGDFTDNTYQNQYDPVGTVTLCSETGDDAVLKQLTTTLDGTGTWSPSMLTKSYTIRVVAGTGVTFTDSDGTTRPLVINEVVTYQGEQFFDTAPVVTTTAGDVVVITHSETGVA